MLCVVVQIVRQSNSDQVTIVGACVTLVEALKAADELASAGINVRVIDPFTIKPIDVDTILKSARQTGGRLVIVEDHYPEGCSCLFSNSVGSRIFLVYFLQSGNTKHFLLVITNVVSSQFLIING